MVVAQDETSDIEERTNKDFYDARTSSIIAREEKQKTFPLHCLSHRVLSSTIFVCFHLIQKKKRLFPFPLNSHLFLRFSSPRSYRGRESSSMITNIEIDAEIELSRSIKLVNQWREIYRDNDFWHYLYIYIYLMKN